MIIYITKHGYLVAVQMAQNVTTKVIKKVQQTFFKLLLFFFRSGVMKAAEQKKLRAPEQEIEHDGQL